MGIRNRFRSLLAVAVTAGILGSSLVVATPAWAAGNYALHFSGSTPANQNYVSTTAASYWATNFMFSADVRWDGTAGYLVAVSRPTIDNAGGSQTGIALGVNDGKPFFALATSAGNRMGGGTSNTTLTPNVWYTIAGSYDGQNVRVFIDGVLDTTQTYGSLGNLLGAAGAKLNIGREFINTPDPDLAARGFHGDIDNVIYGIGTTPATLSPMMRYKFSEGTGTTTADLGPRGYRGTLSASNPPTWVQGSDALTVTYVSTEPGVPAVTQTLRPYSSFTVKAANTFTRTGYTQPSWNTGPGTASVSPGTSITMPLNPLTYYPVWTPTTQSVVYQAGLGDGTDVTQSVDTGTTFSLPTFDEIGFTRPGYHQSGWTQAGVSYSPGAQRTMDSANLTFVAEWVADDQTVTYVLNGGSGNAPTQAAAATGSTITVAGATTFSRPGYRFVGWTDGGVVNYVPGNTYIVSANPIQFTAQWIPIPQTVTYNAGAGATGTAPASTSVETAGSFTVATRGDLARAGYTFGGWRDQSGDVIAEGSTYDVGPSPVTLSAIWIADSHTVTYGNSQNSTGTPPTQADVVTDATFVLADGSALSLAGYAFSGWTDGRVDGSGNPLVYQPGDSYRMGTGDVDLQAVWIAMPHTVSFLRAGGETGTIPSSFVALTDSTFTVPSGSSLTRPGYTFAGWRDMSGLYTASMTYSVAATDVTLVAEWTADTHTVTYSAGLGSGTVPTQSAVATDDTFTAASSSTISRAGYTFAGWSSSAGGTYQVEETVRMGTANITLTALWIANTYNVRYFLTNAATGTAPEATTATTESTFATAGSTGFGRAGYTLEGWFDGSTVTNPTSNYTQGIGDTGFYSRWTAQAQSVTYVPGLATGSTPTQSDVDTDETFTLASGSDLTRPGYSFVGWSTLGSVYPAGFTYRAVPNSMTFTASWRANLHRIVFLNSGGATGALPAAFDLATDASADFATPSITRPGYDFAGWTDGTTTYRLSDIITADGDTPDLVTLTAVWTAQTHSVTYDLNGGTGTVPTNPDSATDDVVTVAQLGDVTRDGFIFIGWSDGASTFQPGEDYLVGTDDVTLTAVWSAVYLSVAYLVGDGATGVPPQQDPIPFNSSLTVASSDGITLDDQYFWGWSDGTTVHMPGSTLANVRDDVTLTATWGDHPLAMLPNTGLDSGRLWLTAFASAFGALLGIALVRRARRRDTLNT